MSYDVSWDCPHQPSDAKLWQESDCYWFYDEEAGVGGFHRIGQKPNLMTGQITAFVFANGGKRFVRNDSYTNNQSIRPSDRWSTGHRVAGHTAESIGHGRMRYQWEEQGSTADLEFYESFHNPRNWSKTGHSDNFMSNINSDGHLECSGRLRGTVTIGGAHYQIDALAHRDRSWGFRDNSRASMHRYRMFSGTLGPELSFASFLLDLKTGQRMVAGFVARNGVDHDVKDLRCITTFDADGISPMGALAVITLENGEQLKINCSGLQGFMTPVPESGVASSDTISTFEFEGKKGFVDLELCTNPGRGTYVPAQDDLSLLAMDQGLSECSSYEV